MIQVAAAIIRRDGKILVCRRGAGGSCAHLWEFPGGKLEPGETLEQCAVRECREELEINISINGISGETSYRYPEREVALTFFDAVILSGEIKKKVHEEIRWVLPAELNQFSFCPGDKEIIQKMLRF